MRHPANHDSGTSDSGSIDSGHRIGPARRSAASALRDLAHAFIGHDVSVDQLEHVSSVLSELTANLTTAPLRTRDAPALSSTFAREFMRQSASESTGESTGESNGQPIERPAGLPEGPIADTYSDRPISGTASPYGLDLDLHREGDEVVARFTLRHAHEGAPGRSHGGFVAAVFDDVYGFVLGILMQPAFTGELNVRYLRPTPLHRLLECRVRLEGQDGRKLLMTGELSDTTTGETVATSNATFITVDPSSFHPGGNHHTVAS